jgi:hypothetical protein
MIRIIYTYKLIKFNIIKKTIERKHIFEAHEYLISLQKELLILKKLLWKNNKI